MNEEPVLITSGLSQTLEVEGVLFEINIFRLEEELRWTLEVVDEESSSHVWEETFASDFAALIEAQRALRTLGPEAFIAGDAVPTIH